MGLRTLLLLFGIVTAVSASGQASGGKLESVESGVTLRMEAPILENGSRKFYLDIHTNDVYECSNFFLENNARIEGNRLTIKVKGVRRMEPCTMAMGPATMRVDLTGLENGTYKVRVRINRQVFKALLTITDTHYDFRIDSEDPSLFRIYNGRLHVIPDDAIWGKCTYADPKKKKAAEKFMAALQDAGAAKTDLQAGNYGAFYLHEGGVTHERSLGDSGFEYPFIFTYPGDMERLTEIMNSFRGKLMITLKNAEGETINNWE